MLQPSQTVRYTKRLWWHIFINGSYRLWWHIFTNVCDVYFSTGKKLKMLLKWIQFNTYKSTMQHAFKSSSIHPYTSPQVRIRQVQFKFNSSSSPQALHSPAVNKLYFPLSWMTSSRMNPASCSWSATIWPSLRSDVDDPSRCKTNQRKHQLRSNIKYKLSMVIAMWQI